MKASIRNGRCFSYGDFYGKDGCLCSYIDGDALRCCATWVYSDNKSMGRYFQIRRASEDAQSTETENEHNMQGSDPLNTTSKNDRR